LGANLFRKKQIGMEVAADPTLILGLFSSCYRF